MTVEAPTDEELASLAGFTVSFFKSNSELWSTFQQALSGDWTPDRLLAAMRNTSWFKKTNQTQREALLLQKSDPQEYQRRLAEVRSRIGRMAVELGIPLAGKSADRIALSALHQGMTDDQIRGYIGNYNDVYDVVVGTKQHGNLGGTIGQIQARLREALGQYGVTVSDRSMGHWLNEIAAGRLTEQHALGEIQRLAKSAFPGMAEEIDAGKTVMDIASSYIESMARTWEINPEDVDLFNPTLRQALSSKDAKGQISMKTIWQFEEDLKKDPRWLKTNNARESLMSVANAVARDFGMVA